MPRWLKEMKESRAKFFVVVFLSSFDVTFPESIQINRIISQPKDQQTWKKVSDLFVVPSSTCYQGRIGTGGNYCNKSCTKDDSKEQYSCNCSHQSATVTYMTNTWVCLENKMVRNKLGEFDKYWVWESMLRNPNDKQIHDTFQLLIPRDLTFYGIVIEVILSDSSLRCTKLLIEHYLFQEYLEIN